MMIPRVLRALAIAIALLGAIDPAVTSTRTTRPEVAVVGGDSLHAALVTRVARELDERFTVIPAPFAAAAATVIVGNRLPVSIGEMASPLLAVIPDVHGPAVTIESVSAPAHAALDARAPVAVTVRALGISGGNLEAALHMGDVIVDRATQAIASSDARHTLVLSFLPTAIGAAPLRVTARVTGPAAGAEPAAADIVIDVRDDRWPVLFFDPRPSWLSTFVRRGIERDARFVVTSRVVTSRNISVDAGRPPATLGDVETLALFDAIVVGAADALTERDVAGLEAFLRRRGGTVIVLFDEGTRGPIDRLTRVRQWSTATSAGGFTIAPVEGDSSGLRATMLAWPATLPEGAHPLAVASTAPGAAASRRPIIWRTTVGAGHLIVSSALDAWRYRDPAQSRFDAFWREIIAEAAVAGSTAIEITPASMVVAPGERTDVAVTLRSVALAEPTRTRGLRATVAASIDAAGGPTPVSLWPDGEPGHLRGSFRAPSTPGIHRLTVTSDGLRADVAVIVASTPARATPDDSDLVGAWVASRGGRTFGEADVDALHSVLEDVVRPTARNRTWYPMRSAWWIIPFALFLGGEWLWRRKRGLA